MEEKRAGFRLSDYIECRYTHKILRDQKESGAVILDISSSGIKMVGDEFVRPGKEVTIDIDQPLGPLTVCGEVLSSKAEWYVTDRTKGMKFTTRIVFKNTPIAEKNKIIRYIYKCRAERRRARFKDML
ncbi:MAG: PilZ domain-containing protein [Candidatus Omnitrophota bacterium]